MNNEMYSLEITKEFLNQYGKFEQISKSSPEVFERFKAKFEDNFNMFKHTRNALVHNRVGASGEYPLIVSKYTLESLIEKINWMTVKAISRCTKISAIESVDLNTPLYTAIKLMNKKNYSYLPIFENNRIKYVISEKAILTILADNEEGVIYDKTIKVSNYAKYFELNNNPNEYYGFINREMLAYDLNDEFSRIKSGKKCGLLFITQNGKENEAVLGMITLWDVAFDD